MYTEDLFTTYHDAANRAAIAAEALILVGIAMHVERRAADKLVDRPGFLR